MTGLLRERGFALLIVLWTMALLAFLGTQITALGRSAAQLSQNLRRAALVEAAADGAVHAAIFHLIDRSPARWQADGVVRELRLPGAIAEIRATDEAGKINPNIAPPALLQALLRATGLATEQASEIANAMVIWRAPGEQPEQSGARVPQYRQAGRAFGPPGEPFQSPDEIGLVLGMTPAILAGLAPHLSIYNQGVLNQRAADPIVRRAAESAAGLAAIPHTDPTEIPRVVSITARATDGMVRFVRHAVVELQIGATQLPYSILVWDTAAGEGA